MDPIGHYESRVLKQIKDKCYEPASTEIMQIILPGLKEMLDTTPLIQERRRVGVVRLQSAMAYLMSALENHDPESIRTYAEMVEQYKRCL